MKYLFLTIICFLIISCKNDEDVKIINQDLMLEVKSFIKKVDNNPPCNSNNIIIEIFKNKIIINNSEPVFASSFLGSTTIKNSKIYFYSSADYSNFIIATKESSKIINIDSKTNDNCDPAMDIILLIDKNDRNKLYNLPPPNLKISKNDDA
jgi:hypothetical protein